MAKKPKTPAPASALQLPVPAKPKQLKELKPPLPKLDSVCACPKCSRPFDRAVKEPKLKYCAEEDVKVDGVLYLGEHIHRTCPFCKYDWKESVA